MRCMHLYKSKDQTTQFRLKTLKIKKVEKKKKKHLEDSSLSDHPIQYHRNQQKQLAAAVQGYLQGKAALVQ